MTGTKSGAKKAMETIRKVYGVDEDGKSRMFVAIGRTGGLISRGGGCAMNHDLAVESGRKGGLASRRTKKNKQESK